MQDLTFIEQNVNRFMGTGNFLIRYSNGHTKYRYNISSIKQLPLLFLTKHYSFNFKKVNYKVAFTEMYPQSPPWEPLPLSNHESEATSLMGSYTILTGIQLPTLLSSILPSSSVSNSLL
jgi:hypothetical protein